MDQMDLRLKLNAGSSGEELDFPNMHVIDEIHDNQYSNGQHPTRGRDAERRKEKNQKRSRSRSPRIKGNSDSKVPRYDRRTVVQKPNNRFKLSLTDAMNNQKKVCSVVKDLILSSRTLEISLEKVIKTVCPRVLTQSSLQTILYNDKHSRFEVRGGKIYLKTNLRVCTKHGKTKTDHDDCNDLHICKFDLVSRCKDRSCAFNHDLNTKHDRRILRMHGLSSVSVPNIRKIARLAMEPHVKSDRPARHSSSTNITDNQRYYQQITTNQYMFDVKDTQDADRLLNGISKAIADKSLPERKAPIRENKTNNIMGKKDETIYTHSNTRDTNYPGVIDQDELSDLNRCDPRGLVSYEDVSYDNEDNDTFYESLPTASLSDGTNPTMGPNQMEHEHLLSVQSSHYLKDENDESSNDIERQQTDSINGEQTSDINPDNDNNYEEIISWLDDAIVDMDKDTISDNDELRHNYGQNRSNCTQQDFQMAPPRSAVEPDKEGDSPARPSSPTSSTNDQKYHTARADEYKYDLRETRNTQNVDKNSNDLPSTIADEPIPEYKPPLREIKTDNIIVKQEEAIFTQTTNRDTNYTSVTIKQEQFSDTEEGELMCDDLYTNTVIKTEDNSYENLAPESPLDDTNLIDCPQKLVHESFLAEQPSHLQAEKHEEENDLDIKGQTSDVTSVKGSDIVAGVKDTLVDIDKDETVDSYDMSDLHQHEEQLETPTCRNGIGADITTTINPNKDITADIKIEDKPLDAEMLNNNNLDDQSNNNSGELATTYVHSDENLSEIATYDALDDMHILDATQNQSGRDTKMEKADTTFGDKGVDMVRFQDPPDPSLETKDTPFIDKVCNINEDTTSTSNDKDDLRIKETLEVEKPVNKDNNLRLPPWKPISKAQDFIPSEVTSPIVDDTNPIEAAIDVETGNNVDYIPLDVTSLIDDGDANPIQATTNVQTDDDVDDSTVLVSEQGGDVERNVETPSSTIMITHNGQQYELQRSGTLWRRKTKHVWVDLGHAEVVVIDILLKTISHPN